MKPSLLIIGGGYLAEHLSPHFTSHGYSVTVLDYPEVDITDSTSINAAITTHRPDYLINAAAYTNTHAAESESDAANQCFTINVKGTANLLDVCAGHKLPWLHVSTGMMFDEPSPHGGWSETDLPLPTCYYAKTKYWADCLLMPHVEREKITITRIHTPVSGRPSPKNLLTKLAGFNAAVTDECSLTILEDYLPIAEKLIETSATGLFHVVQDGITSPHAIIETMKELGIVEGDKQIEKLSMASLNESRGSRAYQPVSILNNEKVKKVTGLPLPDAIGRIREILSHG